MPKYYLIVFCIFIAPFMTAQTQNTIVFGFISTQNEEALPGATVEIIDLKSSKLLGSSVCDQRGKFNIEIALAQTTEVEIIVSFIGFEKLSLKEKLAPGQVMQKNLRLSPAETMLPSVVVSASRTEQRAEETTVSVSVVGFNLIENKNPTDPQQTIDQVPGVHVNDGQINIRSGSGWSYGAGTRVLTMVDDLPLISPDANQVLWPLIPFESIDQIEIVKGASSALYGSSAMNGVMNVRTRSVFTRETFVNQYAGFYSAPARESLKWWDGQQYFSGAQFSHSDYTDVGKGKLGFLLGANFLNDDGFQWQGIDERRRMHGKTAFKTPLAGDRVLEMGVNGTYSFRNSSDAIIWDNPEQALIALDSSITNTRGTTYFIDPYISLNYGDGKINHQDKIQVRYLNIDNVAADDVNRFDNASTSTLLQYQHQAKWDNWVLTGGLFGLVAETRSEIFGNQSTSNQAFFLQMDYSKNRWNFSGGARYESFRVNDIEEARPVFRFGGNYQLYPHTNLYASYGQGFRFPSVAELYTQTNVGMVNIFPSENLRPEFGHTAEVGFKQGLGKKGVLESRLELSVFGMWYDDMIEFTFGRWGEGSDPFDFSNFGFRSLNIGAVRILGTEINWAGVAKLGDHEWQFMMGYTFTDPRALEPDEPLVEGSGTYRSLSSDTSNILKYRYQHLVRADVQYIFHNKIRLGGSVRYNDFMQAIDEIFNNLVGVRSVRERLNRGDFLVDIRAGYQFNPKFSLNLIVDNVFNREVMPRPAMLGMPRRYMVQLQFQL
jgi:outer membrane receptor for ferrienterochelin and colicins